MCVLAQSQDRPAAQERSATSATPSSDAANIAGTVVNSSTGKPLGDVHVRLVALGQDGTPSIIYGAMSDTSGRFAIAGVQPGAYIIFPERTGFVGIASDKKGLTASGLLELKPGAQLADLTLEMSPHSIISGTVRDEYGDPAMDVQITPISLTPQTIMNQFSGSVATDDRGYFRLALPPGRYYIKATSSMHESGVPEIRTDGTTEGAYAETYYPGVAEKSSATALEAKPGAEVNGVEIRMMRTPVLGISGEVFGIPDGVTNLQFTLRSGPDRSHITDTMSQGTSVGGGAKLDGKFQFGHLNPGYYAIFASTTGEQEMRSQIAEITLTDSSVEGLNLTLAPGFEVTGRVELLGQASGASGANLGVKLLTDSESFLSGQDFVGFGHASDPGPNGTFKIRNVFADRYRVVVDPLPENAYIKSVLINGTPAPGGNLDFSNGATAANLKIIVSTNGGRISGRVDSDKGPVMSVVTSVVLFPDHKLPPSPLELQWSNVSSDGTYSFKGLAPGKYRLYATVRRSAFRDTEDKIEPDRAEVVEIKEGDRIIKNLKLAGEEENETPK